MILYRPVGMNELQLVYESGMRAFPPRLPEQPIFYPVLNQEYATQIARDWNTKSGSFVGYVTRFEVEDSYRRRFESHIVGSRIHEELWVPAEELPEFNHHITGIITVVDAYFGPQFRGYIPDRFGFKDRDAVEQFVLLAGTSDDYPMDFHLEIVANNLAVFLHYPFWLSHDFADLGVNSERQNHVLGAIREEWIGTFPSIPLPLSVS